MVFHAAILLILAWAQDSELDARPHVSYAVDVTKAASGEAAVDMTAVGVDSNPLVVAIPAWRPGSYRIQNFHKAVKSLKARNAEGKELDVKALDHQTWSVERAGSSVVTISYTLKPGDASINKSHFEIQGPAVYLYLRDHKELPCRVRFTMPDGWKVATGLAAAKGPDGGVYLARDYDTFADCPTELGAFKFHDFEEGGARYEIMIHAADDFECDVDKLKDTLRKIVGYQARLMGGAPFDRYVFLFHFNDMMGGYGLEHLNSVSIGFNAGAIRRDAATIAGLASHEFFHAWNVKRIRPKPLGPFDYSKAVPTRALWLSEGVTSYYGDLSLVRAGVWNRDQYLRSLQNEITQLQNDPDRTRVSVEAASWGEFDMPGPEPVDYYNKGLLLGLLIDLRMRELTQNRHTFDDVMTFLNGWFVKGGKGPIGEGFEETDILRAVNAVSGRDFNDFFDSHVSGTVELPFKEVLEAAGIACEIEQKSRRGDAGFTARAGRVNGVVKDGPAEAAGLRVGDEVLKVNGKEVKPQEIRAALGELEPGADITITYRRDDKEGEVGFKLGERVLTGVKLEFKPNPTELQKQILDDWLTERK